MCARHDDRLCELCGGSLSYRPADTAVFGIKIMQQPRKLGEAIPIFPPTHIRKKLEMLRKNGGQVLFF